MADLIISPLSAAKIFKYRRDVPEKGHIISTVPFEKWIKRNYCGPACLSMALKYWQPDKTYDQEKIAEIVMDPKKQVAFNSEMLFYPRTQQLISYSFRGDIATIKKLVSQDIPIIVLTKAIEEVNKGHYRVLVGFDEKDDLIIFHDPFFGPRRAMKNNNFVKIWEMDEGINKNRWAMVIFPSVQATTAAPELKDQAMTHINLATSYYIKKRLCRIA